MDLLRLVKTFEDYLEFANAETDNRIMLQSLGAINNTNTIDVISARSKVELGSIEFQIDEDQYVGENIFSGDEFITWNSNVDNLSQYYGKEVDVKVSNKLLQARNSSNSDDVVSFYIPEIISANLYNLKEGKIQPGSYITWNADPNNVNGIILAVEYKPTSQFTEEMVNEYNERLIKGLTIDDVGTFVSPCPINNLEKSQHEVYDTFNQIDKSKIHFYSHHLCHASHAFYSSRFKFMSV